MRSVTRIVGDPVSISNSTMAHQSDRGRVFNNQLPDKTVEHQHYLETARGLGDNSHIRTGNKWTAADSGKSDPGRDLAGGWVLFGRHCVRGVTLRR